MKQFSVIIPTYNGERTIGAVLDGINSALQDSSYEIICIDSGSTDETLPIIEQKNKEYPLIKTYSIPHSQFNHGGTRNLGVKLSRGTLVWFLSQDTIPTCRQIHKVILDDFSDSLVQAVLGRQLPDDNMPFLYQFEATNIFNYFERHKNKVGLLKQTLLDPYGEYTPQHYFYWHFLSNACALYRRTYLISHPFPIVEYGEDYVLGKAIIQNKQTKVYDSRIQALHSVNYSIHEYYEKEMLSLEFYSRNGLAQKKINIISKIFAIQAYLGKQRKVQIGLHLLLLYLIKGYAYVTVYFKKSILFFVSN